MKLGLVSAILPDLGLEALLQLAAGLNLDCVELCCWPVGKADRRYAGVTHLDVTRLDDALEERFRAAVASSGIAISGLGYYPNPLSPDPVESGIAIGHLRAVMAAAERLEIGLVNTFVGRDWTRSVDDNWPRFLETWRPLLEEAGERGLRIGIENCPMLFGPDEWPGGKNLATTPEIWDRMFHDLPYSHWGLNFDPSHLIWQRMDCVSAASRYASRIFHVHAKDATLDRHALDRIGPYAHPKRFHAPKLPGRGEVPWPELFRVLGEGGFDGPVCIEMEDREFEGDLETRRRGLAFSRDFLREFIPA